jgi:hypothetical protein
MAPNLACTLAIGRPSMLHGFPGEKKIVDPDMCHAVAPCGPADQPRRVDGDYAGQVRA